MSEQFQRYADSDEIDFRGLILGLWDGKWTLAGAVALGLGLGAVTSVLLPDRFFFTLDIQPITSFQEDAYAELNSLEFFEVRQGTLLSLFAETLGQREHLIQAFDEVGYISVDGYPDEGSYREAVREAAFDLELTPPHREPPARGRMRHFWELSGPAENEASFRQALSLAFDRAEDNVQEILRQRFRSRVEAAEQARVFTIEDANRAIANARADYRAEMADRVRFLNEQAAIARRLEIRRSSLDAVQIGEARELVGIVQNETPYFARGYEAIEQEIENIESRQFDDSFVLGLRELQAQVRSAEQDPTIERAVSAFENTPLATSSEFKAVQIQFDGMNVERQLRAPVIVGLAGVLGLFAGIGVLLVRFALTRSDT